MQQPFHLFLLLFIIIIYSLFPSRGAQLLEFPSANVSTKWINNKSIEQSYRYYNGATARYILTRNTSGIEFGCGFICPIGSVDSAGSCKSFLFSIVTGGLDNYSTDPRIVWSANRDHPVQENATLEFTKDGDLVLRDFDGSQVWSTNTSGKSVVTVVLNQGSLELFDKYKDPVWLSMDNPTDSMALNQTLRQGQPLKVSAGVIFGASIGSLFAFFLVALCVCTLVRRMYSYRKDADDDEFNILPGLPTRFAFEDIRIATNDFLLKLGKGGFGSVFEGTLVDGIKIAVKRLDGVGQGKKEFLAEVETIGSIHHFHLVKLVGFCAEKFYRLLVYEYMSNGSLDKWIFYKDHDNVLDWQTRRKIIADIAKGLTYLHEECRQKIVHLDIKPQNILLDENFNAKVSDFGLAKLIDRDQIEVITRMRGTPGYLAPEWLTSIITEKVDVFSFGVVVLEIVCGRRNLDYSKDDESFHLIGLLQRKVAENKLVDMLDSRCTDMKVHIKDVIMIIHLAMWCIQSDSNKRPLMSVVLKVLEGSADVEPDLDYNFSNPTPYVSRNVNIMVSAPPTPSILSGPR